jgi:hypothetical protein
MRLAAQMRGGFYPASAEIVACPATYLRPPPRCLSTSSTLAPAKAPLLANLASCLAVRRPPSSSLPLCERAILKQRSERHETLSL